VGACGRSPTVGPSVLGTGGIVASLTPVPVTLRQAPGAVTTYQLSGSVVFRDVGGEGAHVAAIDLELFDVDGGRDLKRTAVDVQLPAGGSVTHQLSETVQVAAGHRPVRLRCYERMRKAEVVLADVLVVAAGVLTELRVGLCEKIRTACVPSHRPVEIVRGPSHHAERRVGPDLHHPADAA